MADLTPLDRQLLEALEIATVLVVAELPHAPMLQYLRAVIAKAKKQP